MYKKLNTIKGFCGEKMHQLCLAENGDKLIIKAIC